MLPGCKPVSFSRRNTAPRPRSFTFPSATEVPTLPRRPPANLDRRGRHHTTRRRMEGRPDASGSWEAFDCRVEKLEMIVRAVRSRVPGPPHRGERFVRLVTPHGEGVESEALVRRCRVLFLRIRVDRCGGEVRRNLVQVETRSRPHLRPRLGYRSNDLSLLNRRDRLNGPPWRGS